MSMEAAELIAKAIQTQTIVIVLCSMMIAFVVSNRKC